MTTINSEDDFLRALSENPAWKAAVRAQILGEELLQLPVKFDAFAADVTRRFEQVDARFEQVDARFEQVDARLSSVEETQKLLADTLARVQELQERMDARMDRMETSQKSLVDDMGIIKGLFAGDIARREADIIASDMGLQYLRTMNRDDLNSLAHGHFDDVALNELRSFRRADLVIEAMDGDTTTYIAVEASFTADERDTGRALRNARLLTDFTGQPARAVIASVDNDRRIGTLVEDGTVYWYPIESSDLVPR